MTTIEDMLPSRLYSKYQQYCDLLPQGKEPPTYGEFLKDFASFFLKS